MPTVDSGTHTVIQLVCLSSELLHMLHQLSEPNLSHDRILILHKDKTNASIHYADK